MGCWAGDLRGSYGVFIGLVVGNIADHLKMGRDLGTVVVEENVLDGITVDVRIYG